MKNFVFLKKLKALWHVGRSKHLSANKEHNDKLLTSRWEKFCLLMWKNWLLQIRHKVQTLVEILIPVAFSGLLVLIRSLVDPKNYPTYTYNELRIDNFTDTSNIKFFELSKLFSKLISFKNVSIPLSFEIGYSPKNPILDKFMRFVKKGTRLRINALANATELERHLISNSDFAGIEFGDHLSNITTLPDKLDYAIRFPGELRNNFNNPNPVIFTWRTDFRFPFFQIGGARNFDYADGGAPPGYYAERFIHLQHVLFNAYVGMRNVTNETMTQIPTIFLRRFPYPAFTQDPLLQGLEGIASLIILLSFVYPCINIVKFITTEKEKQLKEAMKIMGLANWLHWTAWFVKCILFLIVTITCMVVLLTISWYPDTDVAVFTHSNRFALWLFLFIYSISTIMFCFMLSVFFSKANTGAAVAGLLWFVTYAPFTFIAQRLESVGVGAKLFACIFSNAAMGFGIKIIIRHEGSDEGLHWDNFFKPVSIDDNFSIGHVTIMLIVDSVLYLLIALYVERVMPGDYGVPEPWYFPVTKKFWMNTVSYQGVEDVYQTSGENVEAEPVGKDAGIRVKGLRKVYSNRKVAVQGLNLSMYEDQITVLLGHNGAGKTTTMSMLTGMIPPSSGTALIGGKDIRKDIDKVRGSLGLCPQHNILFDELTVREHIQFYSRLKGMKKKDTEGEVQKYVSLLELENKIDMESKTLSGGMQRKLSVGVALCAGSKVVLCDEPTSGIDPAARRALWDLLLKEKKGRTILLSTHFMDEADILGDRIAIMAEGDLKAVGSSFYLKKKFGVGYRLVCVKETGCVTADVTKLLQKYIPDIAIKTNIGSELSYQLKDENVGVFQEMLEDLESNSEKLKLLNYGISLTTMEEVFMKVGSDYTNDENDETPAGDLQNGHANSYEIFENPSLLTGSALIGNQVRALFKKRMYHTLRNWVLYLLQNLIPVIFLVLTISIVRTWRGNDDLPPMKLDLSQYNPTVTLLQTADNVTTDSFQYNVTESYREMFGKVEGQKLINMTDKNMTEYYLKLSKAQQGRVNTQYLTGATVDPKNLTAWFNNQPYHAAPITINLAHNAILKTLFGEDSHMGITNKPLPFKPETRFHMLQAGNNLGFQLAFNLGFAMAFVAAFYIIVYIKERSTKAKLLQYVSGVNVIVYWVTAFIWDYFTFVITALICLFTLLAFQESGWASFDELGRTFVVLLCFGWAVLPILYLASMMFSVPATGFTRMSIFFIFTGIAMFTVIFSMRFEGFNLKDTAEIMTQVFSVFPHFALSDSFSNLNIINVVRKVCQARCDMLSACDSIEDLCFIPVFSRCCETNYFSYKAPGIGRHLTYMICTGVVVFALLILVELRVFEYLFYKSRHLYKGAPIPLSQDGFVDGDVSAENNRINAMGPDELKTHNLVMKDMTKFYKKFLAVNQLNAAVDPFECFGLLGINGAGKTSTFKMLIGDEKISKGNAWVQGVSLKTNMKEVHKRIGYCPQFDALIDDLTGRETLDFYCLLRGVPKEEIAGVTLKLATELNFMKHIDKLVKEYSGGNKRKLSTAVALIGNPSVIYLDEPTTGMDPGAKRHLWSVICKIRNQGRSIVLTSHSMEECEALCTRLAIMVNGEFKCLGSVQHLKSKFSKGFLLAIKANHREALPRSGSLKSLTRIPSEEGTRVEKIKEFITETFPMAVLKEEFQGLLTYQIPSIDLKWSKIFGTMEKAKGELNIEDYSIGQTSLEQVFLAFAKYQRPEDGD